MTQDKKELEKMNSLEIFDLYLESVNYFRNNNYVSQKHPPFDPSEILKELKWRLKLADDYLDNK